MIRTINSAMCDRCGVTIAELSDINQICDTEFEAKIWSNGQCACGNGYYFSETYFEGEDGYSDCYMSIDWDRYE